MNNTNNIGMKKIVLLTLSFVSALSFCSCNKNYDKLIVGEWELDKNAFYELIDDDTCYSDIIRNSNYIYSCTFFDDANIRIGNVDTNELEKYWLLFLHPYDDVCFPYDSLLLTGWNILDTKEWLDNDSLLRRQITYTIYGDSISLSIDSVRIIDKFRVVKLNKGKLILEEYDKNNNLRHFEFNKVGFSWVSYVFDLIGLIGVSCAEKS